MPGSFGTNLLQQEVVGKSCLTPSLRLETFKASVQYVGGEYRVEPRARTRRGAPSLIVLWESRWLPASLSSRSSNGDESKYDVSRASSRSPRC
jgi:hypothetical protein